MSQVNLFPKCPACESILDDATSVGTTGSPRPGSWGFCVDCGKVLRYTDDLGVRAATGDEIAVLPTENKRKLIATQNAIIQRIVSKLAKPPVLPSWAKKWIEPGTPSETPEGRQWMRSRPASIKALLKRFPPECLVRATQPLKIPSPGQVGIVISWMEGGDVSVVDNPTDPGLRGVCDPSSLEVIGYHEGVTPEWIAKVLA